MERCFGSDGNTLVVCTIITELLMFLVGFGVFWKRWEVLWKRWGGVLKAMGTRFDCVYNYHWTLYFFDCCWEGRCVVWSVGNSCGPHEFLWISKKNEVVMLAHSWNWPIIIWIILKTCGVARVRFEHNFFYRSCKDRKQLFGCCCCSKSGSVKATSIVLAKAENVFVALWKL